MICHKTVDTLAKYNKNTGNGTKGRRKFAEYLCASVNENDSTGTYVQRSRLFPTCN